jgi:hypothetical protein
VFTGGDLNQIALDRFTVQWPSSADIVLAGRGRFALCAAILP